MTYDDFEIHMFMLLGHKFYVTNRLNDQTGTFVWACPVYDADSEVMKHDEEFLLPFVLWEHCTPVQGS